MRFSIASILFMTLSLYGDSVQAKWTIDEKTCGAATTDRHKLVRQEMAIAKEMATITASDLTTKWGEKFYKEFIPSVLRNGEELNYDEKVKGTFANMEKALDEDDTTLGLTFKITCNYIGDHYQLCNEGVKAWTSDDGKQMNLCERLIGDATGKGRSEKTSTSAGLSALLTAKKALALSRVKNSIASTILHEVTHFAKTMKRIKPGQKALDYAYGYQNCRDLANGKYDRSCFNEKIEKHKLSGLSTKVLCPDDNDKTKESICSAKKAVQNADSWAYIGVGTYWSKKGAKVIPFPPEKTKAKAVAERHHPRALFRRVECTDQNDDDDVIIDVVEE